MATSCPYVTEKAFGAEEVANQAFEKNPKIGKSPKRPHEAGRDRRNGRRLGDQERTPAVEESSKRPVGVTNVYIFAARLWFHRAEFGVCQCSEEGQNSAYHPGQIDGVCRAHRLHHFFWDEKYSASDNCADDDRSRMRKLQVASEFRSFGDVGGHLRLELFDSTRGLGVSGTWRKVSTPPQSRESESFGDDAA